MNPEVWKEVIIGISVQADQNSHIMENKYGRKDIEVGGTISDKGLDGRNAFSTVKVKAMDNESLTITYGITDHTLNKDKQ